MKQPCIFEAFLAPEDGYVISAPDQVKDESCAILNAASDTTGKPMTVAAYNVVINLDIYGQIDCRIGVYAREP